MAFNPNSTRISAIIQLVLGILCAIVGIIGRVVPVMALYPRYSRDWYYRQTFTAEALLAVWMGVWIIVTGVIGIAATNRRYGNAPNKALLGTFLGFSITSTVFAGVMIICYSIAIIIVVDRSNAKIAMASLILIFALTEFGISIWSAISCCLGYNCCGPPNQTASGQVVYLMTQGPGGAPVAVPVGGVAMPTTSQAVPQGFQTQGHMVYGSPGVAYTGTNNPGVAYAGTNNPGLAYAGTNNPPQYTVAGQQQLQGQGCDHKVPLA